MPYFSYTQIQLGPIILQIWGLFLGLGFLVGYLIVLRQAQKHNIEQKKIIWLVFFLFLASILGARLAYVLQYNIDLSKIFYIWEGGLTFYGGFLGALIVGWVYIKKTKLNFWQIADILVPVVALGIFLGRIGCSLINDHQGTIADLPWAIKWPDGTLRHPVAEYLALNGLIMFFVLYFLQKRLKRIGQLFIVFLIWYSLARFFLDFIRVNDPAYWGLTASQWISLFILICVIILIWRKNGIVFQLRKLFKS
ncbi:MAG: prolipoprotein diacylglyceryl transferase [Parcubacteria group bacterium]|nr:prolipoprotein diacylglyceryl transferase [Parcubacteria group bacterium]|tara:strand:+ start:14740 stop:15492 length:753 start_codon:yes stop_codon:yes gene_type:complete